MEDQEVESNFYPELSEEAKEEAVLLFDKFKKKLSNICEDVLFDLYVNIMPYIESDSWSNFRNQVISAFQGYDKGKLANKYNFEALRKSILNKHREEIIKDLNQDMLKEIENLKETIRIYQERR